MALLLATVVIYFGAGSYVAQKYLAPAMAEFRQAKAARATAAPAAAPIAATPAEQASPAAEPSESATAAPAGALPEWTIAGGKQLAFSLDNAGTPVRGRFRDWSGSIAMDPDHPESAAIRITIRLASASVGDATQDAMLQGADFLASAANPTATWRSARVTRTAPGRYRADGTLTIRGESRPQPIAFTLTGQGGARHVTGTATIDRTAFGIGSGEAGEALGKTVALSFAFDAKVAGR
jgi:polyisoprenoid-binding protein YceI